MKMPDHDGPPDDGENALFYWRMLPANRLEADPTGIIIHKGYIAAEWGDPLRVDMTHSVTKSLLSSVVGIAVERSMIRSVDDAVRDYVAPIQIYAAPTTNKSDRLNTPDL